jgi:hypothetical protein
MMVRLGVVLLVITVFCSVYFVVTRIVMDSTFSISWLSQMLCHR